MWRLGLALAALVLTWPGPTAAQMTTPSCSESSAAVSGLSGTKVVTGDHNDIVDDCNTLLAIKDTLLGAGEGKGSLNWDAGTAMNTWNGVSLTSGSEPPRVANLTLTNKDWLLTGSIPAAIGNLSELRILNLHGNRLTEGIPAELGNLSSLWQLNLSNNQLTGMIPAGVDDDDNPTGLAKLGNLSFLILSNNQLTGTIPATLGNLSNLTQLNLSNNQLTGTIPAALGNLSNLTHLSLSGNQLTGGIPARGTNASPTGLAKLSKLRELSLSGNQLTGGIPAGGTNASPTGLAKLSTLRYLYLHNNKLGFDPQAEVPKYGIPAALGNLTSLRELVLHGNALTGTIPAALGNLSGLQILNLSGNQLDGTIPAGVDDDDNPTGLAKLSNLRELVLHGNALTGPVHTALGNLAPNTGALTFLCLPADLTPPTALNSVLQCPTLRITSTAAAAQTYLPPESITVSLTWNKALAMSTTKGMPELTLQIDNAARTASSASSLTNSDKTLTFSYSVKAEDNDDDGIAIRADQLQLNGATLTEKGSSSNINLSHRALPAQSDHLVGSPSEPTLQAQLHPGRDSLFILWDTWLHTGYEPTLYEVRYCRGTCLESDPSRKQGSSSGPSLTLSNLMPGQYTVWTRVQVVKAGCKGCRTLYGMWEKATATVGAVGGGDAPTTDPPPATGGGTTGGGGGRGGRDRHGNTPAQATPVRLRATAPWRSTTTGEINTFRDRDYFRLSVPHAGILVVETTGTTDTVGTVWQDGDELGTATGGGTRRNFRLSVPVAAGPVVIAVTGNRGRTGRYSLRTRLLVGVLENPAPRSFQSGIGVISGWVCAAEAVEIELNGQRQPAATGTARADTAPTCGTSDTGFGLLFNWNLLGDGEHTVVALVGDIEFARATVTVTTLGAEVVDDVVGTCEVADFPSVGESVTVQWQASSQNFVITEGAAPTAATQAGTPGVGFLENPRANAFQSGIGLISGWACEADAVEIVFNAGPPQAAGYGTARADTVLACGDADNGFGLLYNWNLLGDGEHEVVALVDGVELGRAVVRVTTLGEETVEEAEGTCVVEDFPGEGDTVTLRWQPSRQNFGIVAYEPAAAGP